MAPIFDGFVLETGIRWVGLGGKDITRHLAALVNAKVQYNAGNVAAAAAAAVAGVSVVHLRNQIVRLVSADKSLESEIKVLR